MSPLVAPRVISLRCESSDAIGGEADMARPLATQSGGLPVQTGVWSASYNAALPYDIVRSIGSRLATSRGLLCEREVSHVHPIGDVVHPCGVWFCRLPNSSGRGPVFLPRTTNHNHRSVPCRRKHRDRRSAPCRSTVIVPGAACHHRESSGRRRRAPRREGGGKRKARSLHPPAHAGRAASKPGGGLPKSR